MTRYKTLYFVRHGLVHNPLGASYGRLPGFGLSEVGREQARRTASHLRALPIEAMYRSPLQRAQETSDILSEGRDLPTKVDDRIDEWEGEGHGETPEQVCCRMRAFVDDWVNGPEQVAVAVSHRDPIRALLIGLTDGIDWREMPNLNIYPLQTGGVYAVTYDGARFSIRPSFSP